jgi:hypothetical protein
LTSRRNADFLNHLEHRTTDIVHLPDYGFGNEIKSLANAGLFYFNDIFQSDGTIIAKYKNGDARQ